MPYGVTSIGGWAFAYCSSLTEIVMPDSVTSIGGHAFEGCSSLTEIVMPDSVTKIGYGTFDECDSLTDVYYSGSESQWASINIGEDNVPLTYATVHYYS